MNRINTGRQGIAAKQRNCNYKPSGAISQHVYDATIEDATIAQPVKRAVASRPLLIGKLVILPGQHFYLVASAKFTGRYYAVLEATWQCSSPDSRVAAQCITAAKAYRESLIEAGHVRLAAPIAVNITCLQIA